MLYLILVVVSLLIIIGVLFVFIFLKRKSLGSIGGNNIYTDTKTMPGDVLYSDTLQLKGKPDYIIKKGTEYIPVEVKTGKTPSTPYPNHTVQLFAYCALIEEKYSVRPSYGVIKYPEREFEIMYSEKEKTAIQKLIHEMQDMKTSGVEPQCNHPEHNSD